MLRYGARIAIIDGNIVVRCNPHKLFHYSLSFEMNRTVGQILYWSPRALCLLATVFLMLFSLDVFNEAASLKDILIGLLMHNLPSITLFGLLALAWKWEWIGAVVFPAGGAFYIYMAWMKFPLSTYFLISGPFFLVGILFLINWIYRDEIKLAKLRHVPPSVPSNTMEGATFK